MNYKGIVFFDYDGTLADEEEGIFSPTQETCQAIKKMSENGYLSVLATGRAKCYAPQMDIDFGGYVTSNGAYAEVMGKPVYESYIPVGDIKDFSKKLDELGVFYSYENQKKCFANDKNAPVFSNMLTNFKIRSDVFFSMEEGCEKNISKMLIAHPDISVFEMLQEEFRGRLVIEKHRSYTSADVGLGGISKAVGARELAKSLKISKENIYSFGDGVNDYELFKFVGHPIAMGHHAKVLEECAEYITETVKNEGIKKGLLHFGLI